MLKKWQGYLATLESNRGKAHADFMALTTSRERVQVRRVMT
jgi:hypothetical protein